MFLDPQTLVFIWKFLNAEGDEQKKKKKKQVCFLLQDLFANCCLILQVAQDFGRSFLAWVCNV